MVWACVVKRKQRLCEKCIEYEVEGSRMRYNVHQRGLGETHKLNKENAMEHHAHVPCAMLLPNSV